MVRFSSIKKSNFHTYLYLITYYHDIHSFSRCMTTKLNDPFPVRTKIISTKIALRNPCNANHTQLDIMLINQLQTVRVPIITRMVYEHFTNANQSVLDLLKMLTCFTRSSLTDLLSKNSNLNQNI